jgi:hypothetical protein
LNIDKVSIDRLNEIKRKRQDLTLVDIERACISFLDILEKSINAIIVLDKGS